jgi:hypothetical protein
MAAVAATSKPDSKKKGKGPLLIITLPFPPQYPLPGAPFCLKCSNPTQRTRTGDQNPNGNAGRYYYICRTCKTDAAPEDQMKVGWSTWDDNIGVHDGNPHCNCGHPSRLDRMNRSGQGFWTCATGGCSYYSSRLDGHTAEDLYFENRGY